MPALGRPHSPCSQAPPMLLLSAVVFLAVAPLAPAFASDKCLSMELTCLQDEWCAQILQHYYGTCLSHLSAGYSKNRCSTNCMRDIKLVRAMEKLGDRYFECDCHGNELCRRRQDSIRQCL